VAGCSTAKGYLPTSHLSTWEKSVPGKPGDATHVLASFSRCLGRRLVSWAGHPCRGGRCGRPATPADGQNSPRRQDGRCGRAVAAAGPSAGRHPPTVQQAIAATAAASSGPSTCTGPTEPHPRRDRNAHERRSANTTPVNAKTWAASPGFRSFRSISVAPIARLHRQPRRSRGHMQGDREMPYMSSVDRSPARGTPAEYVCSRRSAYEFR